MHQLEGFLGEGNSAVDLTELVYEKTIPGENVTFAKKMFDSVLESNRDPSSTAEDRTYYTATFASGMTGIAYNATVLAALGFEEPNTTDELFAICESIATGNICLGRLGRLYGGRLGGIKTYIRRIRRSSPTASPPMSTISWRRGGRSMKGSPTTSTTSAAWTARATLRARSSDSRAS